MAQIVILALTLAEEAERISTALADVGLVVVRAEGMESLERLARGPGAGNVLVIDDDFPGLKVARFVDEVLSDPLAPPSVTLLRCSEADPSTRAVALRAGVDDVLPRPGHVGLLLARIRQAQRRNRQLAQWLRRCLAQEPARSDSLPTYRDELTAATELVPAPGPRTAESLAEALVERLVRAIGQAGGQARSADLGDWRRPFREGAWVAWSAIVSSPTPWWVDLCTTCDGEEAERVLSPWSPPDPKAVARRHKGLAEVLNLCERASRPVLLAAGGRVLGSSPKSACPREELDWVQPSGASLGAAALEAELRGARIAIRIDLSVAQHRVRRLELLQPGDVLLEDLFDPQRPGQRFFTRGTFLTGERLERLRLQAPQENRERGISVFAPPPVFAARVG